MDTTVRLLLILVLLLAYSVYGQSQFGDSDVPAFSICGFAVGDSGKREDIAKKLGKSESAIREQVREGSDFGLNLKGEMFIFENGDLNLGFSLDKRTENIGVIDSHLSPFTVECSGRPLFHFESNRRDVLSALADLGFNPLVIEKNKVLYEDGLGQRLYLSFFQDRLIEVILAAPTGE